MPPEQFTILIDNLDTIQNLLRWILGVSIAILLFK